MQVSETVREWEVLNDNQALWLRPPGDVKQEEYAKFYKALAKVWDFGFLCGWGVGRGWGGGWELHKALARM